MATTETTCKVTFIGVWDEDKFTDDVMKSIAAYAQAEKGKKVKVVINKDGIRISRSKMFQENLVRFYPYEQIKAVTKNPRFTSCIMLILGGTDTSYKIIAFRCPSDSNSIYLVNRISHFRDDVRGAENVEFRKHDNGNWTLRERSAHNANMHLKEIFKEREEQEVVLKVNGDGDGDGGDSPKLNGGVHYVPVLDKSQTFTTTETTAAMTTATTTPRRDSYIKHNGSVKKETVVVQENDMTGELHVSVKDDGLKDADDLNDLMKHVKVADVVSGGSRRGILRQDSSTTSSTLPSKYHHHHYHQQQVVQDEPSGPTVLRATSRTYDTHIVAPGGSGYRGSYYNQWAPHRRVSGDFVIPPRRYDRKYSMGTASLRSYGAGSMRVQFDNESVTSMSVPRKSTSMRIRPVTAGTVPVDFSTSTTVHRSIENTYGRPVVFEPGYHTVGSSGGSIRGVPIVRQSRPSSVHVMSGNELRVFQHGTTMVL